MQNAQTTERRASDLSVGDRFVIKHDVTGDGSATYVTSVLKVGAKTTLTFLALTSDGEVSETIAVLGNDFILEVLS